MDFLRIRRGTTPVGNSVLETIFRFDERNYQHCQQKFRGPKNQEYYLGDYSIDASPVVDVTAEKKAVGACSIVRLRSKSLMCFRRSWSHIREDATDVAVLWFVKRGRLHITHQAGTSVAKAGDLVYTESVSPFYMECRIDDDMMHEVLHIIVPTHVLRHFVPYKLTTGFCISAAGLRFDIAERLFNDIFEDAGELTEEVTQVLFNSALTVVSDAIKDRLTNASARQRISDERLQDVLWFIESHISDPKLSIATIATGCRISPRYLSSLLKAHRTSYTRLVWERRLKIASEWLSQSRVEDVSIREIAYRVGFKSPEHFSRRFKRAYEVSPCDYRAVHMATRAKGSKVIPAPERRTYGVAAREQLRYADTSAIS
jgi:AraC-like DNA-binding protein